MNDCLIVTPCSNSPNITNNVKTQISPSAIMVIKAMECIIDNTSLCKLNHWGNLPYMYKCYKNSMVGGTGVEPVTSAMSTQRSPAELTALDTLLKAHLALLARAIMTERNRFASPLPDLSSGENRLDLLDQVLQMKRL